MSDRWAWAHEVWSRCFAPLQELGVRLERVDGATYWRIHEAELRPHFPPEVFFDTGALRSEAARAGQEHLGRSWGHAPLRDHCILWDGDRVAGSFCGELKSESRYRMWHTCIHPDHRRRGLYRQVLASTIAYTAELGFDEIVSEHAPGNNPVLLAKLGAGFRITGFDVQPMVGLSVHLTYFHSADLLALYEYRCGLATLGPRILEAGSGAIGELIAQFTAGR